MKYFFFFVALTVLSFASSFAHASRCSIETQKILQQFEASPKTVQKPMSDGVHFPFLDDVLNYAMQSSVVINPGDTLSEIYKKSGREFKRGDSIFLQALIHDFYRIDISGSPTSVWNLKYGSSKCERFPDNLTFSQLQRWI